MHYKMLLHIKPNPRPKDTRREGEHFHWFTKMIIHETKQEPNKKSSNSTIISQKHPDEHNRQTNGQNTQHEYKYYQNRLGTVSNG